MQALDRPTNCLVIQPSNSCHLFHGRCSECCYFLAHSCRAGEGDNSHLRGKRGCTERGVRSRLVVLRFQVSLLYERSKQELDWQGRAFGVMYLGMGDYGLTNGSSIPKHLKRQRSRYKYNNTG